MYHPLYYTLVRASARRELRRRGYGFADANHILAGASADEIDAATVQAGTEPPAEATAVGWLREPLPAGILTGLARPAPAAAADPVPAPHFGDGHIIRAVLAFLESPAGAAVVAALLKLLAV